MKEYEIIIITCRHDPKIKLDKEKIKRLLETELDLEIIRIERGRRL